MITSTARLPLKRLALLVLVLFVAETIVMFVLPLLPAMPAWSANLLDAGLAVILSSPVLYYVLFHPMEQIAEDNAQRKIAEEAVTADKDRIRLLLDSTAEGIYGVDLGGNCTLVNKSCLKLLGYGAEELLGRRTHETMHHSHADGTPRPAESCQVYQAFREGRPLHVSEDVFWRKDGTSVPVEFWSYPMFKEGKVIGSVATFIDITERKRAAESLAKSETQLRQAQKMESIGRLAGGVAHDFNNLLTVILGLSDISIKNLPPDHALNKDLMEIKETAQRAAKLTHQLLAFSRKQIIEPKVIDLNELIENVDKMLRRIIGEDIALSLVRAPGLWLTRVDSGQIEQVIVNLCVNARDAMPTGGKISIETSNATLEGEFKHDPIGPAVGEYVLMAVSDNGSGMSDEVKTHLFEPFFTTKPKDKGTGLGLATCFGIIKQSGGYVSVDSEPGHGTTFKIYLPRTSEKIQATGQAKRPAENPRGTETILIAEDEPAVRGLASRMLRGQGYKVVEAANAQEALKFVKADAKNELQLLITDVVMPKGGGKFLADAVRAARPDFPVIYTSGYTDDAIARHGSLEPGINFLSKPFNLERLSRKVRDVLDSARGREATTGGEA